MGTLIMISGANGSGKSRYAERIVARTTGERYYIATMRPCSEENLQRIEKHREQRKDLQFTTLECPYQVGAAAVERDGVVLLEDVSNLLANAMFERGGDEASVYADIEALCSRCRLLVAVTITGLRADGYDLNEIAVKLVHNYIRQITVYRFFHADPHPGNIRVQDGKIVWLDLGMMGRISPREAELYLGIIRTIYEQDVPALTDTLLSLGQYTRMPDRQALAERIGIFLHKYEAMPMADMDMGVLVDEFVQILNEYGVSVPGSLTMLGRSLLVIQGMLTSVSPDANVIEIVAEYVKNTALSREHIEKKVKTLAQQLARSGEKLTVLPAQLSEFFGKANAGQLTVNVKKSWSDAARAARSKLLGRLIFALLDCSLLFCAAITCLAPLPRVSFCKIIFHSKQPPPSP